MDADLPAETQALRNRLRGLGWGLLLVWTGLLILLPGELEFLWYVWLAGVGAILLGFAALGGAVGLRVDWDGVILGVACAVSGAGGLAGLSISVVGLILALFGVAFIVKVGVSGWESRTTERAPNS